MNGLTILGIIIFIGAWWLFYRMVNWELIAARQDASRGRTNTEKVEDVFNRIWNGKECSRKAAWYRTVQRLRMGDFPEELAIEAELRLMLLQYGKRSGRRSDYTVTRNGRVVHITELGGRDDSAGAPV